MRAHIGLTTQEQDAAQDYIRVQRFFFHFVVDALIQTHEPLIFILARVDEVLIAGRKLTAQQFVEAGDDFGMTLHSYFSQESDGCLQYGFKQKLRQITGS